MKPLIRQKIKIFSLADFGFIGVFIFSYAIEITYALILIPVLFVIRLIFEEFETRHIIRLISLILVALIAYFFSFMDLYLLAIICFILKTVVIHISFLFIKSKLPLEKIPMQFLNGTIALLIIKIFGSLMVEFLR